MQRHSQLTTRRIDRFAEMLWGKFYAEKIPLSAKYAHSINPVSFKKISTLKFKPIKQGAEWGGNWESAWFKFSGKVPPGWKSSEVMACIDTGSEACVFDRTGNPVAGLTSSGSPWMGKLIFVRKVLFLVSKSARGNEKVELLVEAGANELFGPAKACILKEAALARFRRDLWDLYHDFWVLYDLMLGLPDDHPKRAKIMSGLNEVVNIYGTGEEKNVSACRKILKRFYSREANASADLVSAIGHSHIDTAWLWPLRETVRKVGRTFSSVLRHMEEYPDYKFGASQPQLYEFCKKHYPGLYERVKKAVRQKRWELQGGMWVEADANIISGESMVRQILHGKRFFIKEFGVEVDNLWLPDAFGYSAALPQIMKKSGINYFLTQKLSWNQFDSFPHHTMLWEGLDGTRVFTHFPPANNYNGCFLPQELIAAGKRFLEKDRTNRWIYLFGYGDGGVGPSRHQLEFAKRVKDTEELPKVKMEFAKDFFKKAEKDIKDILTWKGELYLEYHRGTYTTQARNKRANRKSELLLRDIEWLDCFNLKKYPSGELERLWKLVLLNQFHDIIPGSSITWVYKDSQKQYADVFSSGHKLLSSGSKALLDRIDTRGDGTPVVVVNSLSWDREGIVSIPLDKNMGNGAAVLDSKGNVMPSQVVNSGLVFRGKTPAMGYAVFFVKKGRREQSGNLKATKNLLENEILRVTLNDKGYIASIYDKEAGREVIPAGRQGNVLALYNETGEDAWDTHIYYEEMKPTYPVLLESKVTETGPVRINILQKWAVSKKSTLIQEIRLSSKSRAIEFSTKVDWHEDEKMLRTSFPVNVHSMNASYETQFGFIERPAHRNTSWDMAKFEVCGHKWADISEDGYGVALLNDCKYGYKILGNVIDLNLLRSPKSPDPVADMGEHIFTYALYPHTGDFKRGNVIRAGYELNVPLRSFIASAHPGKMPKIYSMFSVTSDSVIIDTVKKAEDGNSIIVRMYEAFGGRGEVRLYTALPVKRAVLTDLLERKVKNIACENGCISLYMKPFEIVTLRLNK